MLMDADFLKRAVPCKLGTVPALVITHGRDKIEVGRWVRIKEMSGDKWHAVLVTAVQPNGYFKADR